MQPHNAFLEQANPHAWLLVAENLFSRSIDLARASTDLLTLIRPDGSSVSWHGANRAVFLLGGFALENFLKALLVYENPAWVSNGKLSGRLKSHCLTRLHSQSKTAPYRKRAVWVLEEFEAGLESWARYPCGLDEQVAAVENHLTSRLWQAYIKLGFAYGRRLQSHLSKGWQGPHGFHIRHKFEGSMFSHDEHSAQSLAHWVHGKSVAQVMSQATAVPRLSRQQRRKPTKPGVA